MATEYRVDELARAAGTTVRNVRAYQDRGLLPPPRREGRVGFYNEAHLARLNLIGRLLDRGFSLSNIAELIAGLERGHDLGQLMGLEEAVTSPWSDEVPTHMSPQELLDLFGPAASLEALTEAVEMEILEIDGDRFKVNSPRLLHAGAELAAAGIPLDVVGDELRRLRRDVDGIASRFVEMAAKQIFDRYGDDLPPAEDVPRLADLVWRLRPLAEMVVDAELARAMERHAKETLGQHIQRAVDHQSARDNAS
jgi:DNA-binding transcriptional MerR regulator